MNKLLLSSAFSYKQLTDHLTQDKDLAVLQQQKQGRVLLLRVQKLKLKLFS